MREVRFAKVQALWDNGVGFGGPPGAPCAQCADPWGEHVLVASFGSPFDGGLWECPTCPCTGTWTVTDGAMLKAQTGEVEEHESRP